MLCRFSVWSLSDAMHVKGSKKIKYKALKVYSSKEVKSNEFEGFGALQKPHTYI